MSGYYHIEIMDCDPKVSDQVDTICKTLDDTTCDITSSWTDVEDVELDDIEIDLPENKITTFMITFYNHIQRNRYYKMTIS